MPPVASHLRLAAPQRWQDARFPCSPCPVSPRPGTRSSRARRDLSPARILETASRILAEEGLERLTNARIAQRLDVTPAAIRWHLRSTHEILERLIEAAAATPPPAPRQNASWRRQLGDLTLWFREQLLARKELVREPACWGQLLLAFAPVELAARRILETAGFGRRDVAFAGRALYRQSFVFVYQDAFAMKLAAPSFGAAFESALADLPADERVLIASRLHESEAGAPDALFRYAIDALLDGLEARHGATARRPRGGRS